MGEPVRSIRVQIPYHLRVLASVEGEIQLAVEPPITIAAILDVLEAAYPVLRGAIRDSGTQRRRALIRYYTCQQDVSNQPPTDVLPEAVADGQEAFLIIGALAGG